MRFTIKILTLVYFISAFPSYAGEKNNNEPIKVNDIRLDIDQSSSVIEAIMSMKAFDTTERRKDWNFDFSSDEEEQQEQSNQLWRAALVILAQSLEYILWLIPIIVLFVVVKYRNQWLSYLKKPEKKITRSAPQSILGLEINQSELPENITESVRQLWNKGKERDSISILFRASIMSIIKRYDVELSSGYTENQCIDAVNYSTPEEISQYFRTLTQIWVRLAYGHIKPEFKLLDELCFKWDQLLGRSRTV